MLLKKPTPIFGLLAPETRVRVGELEPAFSAFYQTLIKSGDLLHASNAFTDKTDGKKYAFIFSQLIFEKAAEDYITQECMGINKRKRLDKLLTVVNNERRLTLKKKRRLLKQQIYGPQALYLKRFHKKFMMVNLYPENAERFKFDAVKFEQSVRNKKR